MLSDKRTVFTIQSMVMLSGMKMAMTNNAMATALTVDNCNFVETLPDMALEQARPIIIKSQ